MASGEFTAYAPPAVFGPWTTAIDGLGYAASIRIAASPLGETTVFGEAKFWNEAGIETVQPFQGAALIRTCNCLQNILVRFKGVPLGSAVEGTWQTSPTRGERDNPVTPKGLSLHIGLNRIDPDHYGWDGRLMGCENDARYMRSLAQSCGYRSKLLLNERAISTEVLKNLAAAAKLLLPGDILFITYAGHGSQVPDANGDEDDGLDETWLLYDRMLTDDELYVAWSRFRAGVRIVMVSDSCHSGTMARDPIYLNMGAMPDLLKQYGSKSQPIFRALPDAVSARAYKTHQALYDAVAWSCVDGDRASVAASVIMLAGCQDNQTSADGRTNGLFTEKLKMVWEAGFQGNYYDFTKAVRRLMPKTQTPHYYAVGQRDSAFEDSRPFAIGGSQSNRSDVFEPSKLSQY